MHSVAARLGRFGIISQILTLIFVLINPKYANAQYFSGPVAASMGGAGRASASGPETAYLNPAGLPHLKDFHVGYIYRYQDQLQGNSSRDGAFVVADAHEGVLVPAAFSYLQTDRVLGGRRLAEETYQLSLGNHIWDQLALGVTGLRWSQKGEHLAEDVAWQMGVGLLYTPLENFGFGFTAQNILDDGHRENLRPEMGLGFHYLYEELLRLRADVVYPTKFNPNKKGILMAGMESVLIYDLHFRFGGRWDDVANRMDWTAGLGWDGPRLALDFTWEQDPRQNELSRQSFDLRLFF